jgi:Domain of unknown function (DUF4430)
VRYAAALLVLLAVALTGCGERGTHGTATLWITQDRGAHVLLARSVPAGETAMQALTRAAKLKTRYGGRFVQAINGLDGSLSARRDWFYFVNGIAPSRGATEVKLHPGDVEWWDYRSWGDGKDVPVVVGSFPEPFLHSGRPAVVVGSGPVAQKLATVVQGRVVRTAPKDANVLQIVPGTGFTAHMDGGRVVFTLGAADAARLAANTALARYRYEGLS